MYEHDNLRNPGEEVIDIGDAQSSSELEEDEMEYLSYLYEDGGMPMVEKLLRLHPFERVVRMEERKGFFEKLLDFFKA
jgi:hypothetical protein